MRSMWLIVAVCLFVMGLSGCSNIPSLTDELATIDRIGRECRAFGLVRRPASLILDFVPVPGIKGLGELVAIGLDQVCADPARFARDESTIAWMIKNARR